MWEEEEEREEACVGSAFQPCGQEYLQAEVMPCPT